MKNKNTAGWMLIATGMALIAYAILLHYSTLENVLFQYNPAWHLLKHVLGYFKSALCSYFLGIALVIGGGLKIVCQKIKKGS